jgi:hypothetical protein
MSAPETIREAVERLSGLAAADPAQAAYLSNLLSFQIVKGRYTLLDLKNLSADVLLDTLAAPQLRIAGNTEVAQGQAFAPDTLFLRNVVKADIEVCGGILHWVNTVFEPRDPVSNEIVNPRDPIVNPRDPVSNEIVNPRDPVSNEIVNPRDPLPGAAPCSMAVLMSIMSATDPAAAVVELGTSNPPCAQCLGRCTDPATMQACGSACAIGGGR